MNDRALRASPTGGHQNGIECELPPQRRLCGPADDLSREEIHHDSKVKPAFPCTDVGNIGNPSLIRLADSEVALQNVWNELRGLRSCMVSRSIPAHRSNLVDAHKPHHTMLAARLPSLAEIEEYSRCTVMP